MGWDFYNDPSMDKKRIVAEKVRGDDMRWDGWQARILAHSLRGNNLWRVIERTDPAGASERFIALDLLKSGGRDSGWGYKGISESMGPCEVNCPLYFFDLVPEPAGTYGAEWRGRVRAAVASKRKVAKLAPGMAVTIYGKPYTLLRKRQPRGWIVRAEDGAIYRATRGIEPVAATH